MRVPGEPFQGRDRREFAAVAGDGRAAGLVGRPRLQADLGDAADGGQRLAAKAERVDAEEIVGIVQLAGGVAGEGQRQVLGQRCRSRYRRSG